MKEWVGGCQMFLLTWCEWRDLPKPHKNIMQIQYFTWLSMIAYAWSGTCIASHDSHISRDESAQSMTMAVLGLLSPDNFH